MRMSDWSSDVCSSDLDRVDRARFLTEAAIDALRHVDVVARSAARPVVARLGLDRDRLRRADRPAQLARDSALLAVRIAAQAMLAVEERTQRVRLARKYYRSPRLTQILRHQPVHMH